MITKTFRTPLLLIAAMFLVFVLEFILPGDLAWLGIRPRSILGLFGIPFAPFLHVDLSHLIANAFPLFVMGAMLNSLDQRQFIYRTIILILGSGALTWCISSSGIVIGASGLVFAYWSFLIVNGLRTRDVKEIVMAVFTITIYGGLLLSLFENTPGVSWAGHFGGAAFGAVFAWISGSKS